MNISQNVSSNSKMTNLLPTPKVHTVDAYTAFRLWRAADLHFKTQYSIIKYNARVKDCENQFEKLSLMEKTKFRNLGLKFKSRQDYCVAMIGCYLDDVNPRFDTINTVLECYVKILKRKESMEYELCKALSVIQIYSDSESEFKLQDVLDLFLRGDIPPEFIIMLENIDPFLEYCYNDLRCIGYKNLLFVLQKYKELFDSSKYHEKVFGKQAQQIRIIR